MTNAVREFILQTERDSIAFARRLADHLRSGQPLLMSGPVGAGKSLIARSMIQYWMSKEGVIEDVPSPTFTLIQVYDLAVGEVWHCDLYRLTDPAEILELGLEEAMENRLCLIEWPDRLGEFTPANAWHLTLQDHGEGRLARLALPNDVDIFQDE